MLNSVVLVACVCGLVVRVFASVLDLLGYLFGVGGLFVCYFGYVVDIVVLGCGYCSAWLGIYLVYLGLMWV